MKTQVTVWDHREKKRVPIKGRELRLDIVPSHQFVIHRPIFYRRGNCWMITELRTGLHIYESGPNETQKATIQYAIAGLKRRTDNRVDSPDSYIQSMIHLALKQTNQSEALTKYHE